MARRTRQNPEPVETLQAPAEEPRRMDVTALRASAQAPTLLSPEELDERQAAIGPRRRRGGPSLRAPSARRRRPSQPPAVPPTEATEPPAS